MLNSRKIMKIMSTLNFETPQLQLNPDYFRGKVPAHNNVAPQIYALGRIIGGGGV